ncbi:hypothetical protein F4808DRAFT_424000 [Astrocystis sublimbata]|nr:hypothetical protein F4808DRAFT_424000 [Astrocystis sublimbata]
MSSMSRNNSTTSLMGFSVHQPSIGAPLQFFPAMGSQQLDEMINTYIPGNISIIDKRAAVSMEFFQYSIATGNLFKFFMVYPSLTSANTSPTMDSGDRSSSATSPVMSEAQWASTSTGMASPSSTGKTSSPTDFSDLPGMKIMTKDGRDVTNSASRGCKTKEQRDHAHLMRIMKACDSCRRKKTKCDPSHKRSLASASSGKKTKTSKTSRPAAAPPQEVSMQTSSTFDIDQFLSESSVSPDTFFAESLYDTTDAFTMDWEKFIQYEDEPAAAIPYDYNFLLDPAGNFSPAMTDSFTSSSTSPSQLPITPLCQDVHISGGEIGMGHGFEPTVPYLNPGGVGAGEDYVDFNLFSPQSSFLDEELGWAKEVAASPIPTQASYPHARKPVNAPDRGARSPEEPRIVQLANESEAPLAWSQRDSNFHLGKDSIHETSDYIQEWSSNGLSQTACPLPARLPVPHPSLPTEDLMVDEQMSSRALQSLGRRRTQSSRLRGFAVNATATPEDRQVSPQVCPGRLPIDADARSTSSQLYRTQECGHCCTQDGLNSVERACALSTAAVSTAITAVDQPKRTRADVLVRNGQSSATSDGLKISKKVVHNVKSKIPAVDAYCVQSTENASSPAPPVPSHSLGVTAPGSSNARSPLGETLSWEPFGMKPQAFEHPVSTQRPEQRLCQQAPAMAAVRANRSERLEECVQSTSVIRTFATPDNQSMVSNTIPATQMIAGLSALSRVTVLLATVAKSIHGTRGVQSATEGSFCGIIFAVLLLSLALFASPPLVPILLFGAYSIASSGFQLQRLFLCPNATTRPSSPSHKLRPKKQTCHSSTNFQFAFARVSCLV